jgi:23S rRNA pseudouridine2605 synthase
VVEEPSARGEAHNVSYRLVLHEGRNREVRRMWQAVGYEVSRLLRIRYGPIELPRDLRAAQWRLLDDRQIAGLATAAAAGTAAASVSSPPPA